MHTGPLILNAFLLNATENLSSGKDFFMKTGLLLFAVLLSFAGFSQRFRIADNKLMLTDPVAFKAETTELLPESETVLKNVKLFLDEKTFISLLRIEGHVASEDAAQNLSEKRALAVVKWLVKEGIDCKRLLAVGFGNTKPAAAADAADKAPNAKIIFAVAALRGTAVGGMPVDGGGKVAGDACQ